jgi:hypothetical protein
VLHEVPLGMLTNGIVDQVLDEARKHGRLVDLAERLPLERSAKGRPPKWDDTHWERVASVYREAGGRTPTQAVVDAFGVKRSTASAWVRRCRELGFLGPTEPRRPGERNQVETTKKGTKR